MKGHPVLGAVAGFFFGLFLAIDIQQFGVYPLTSLSLFGLPLLGLLLGLGIAAWGPFGRKRAAQASAVPASDAPAPAEQAIDDAPPAGQAQ